MHDIKIRYYKFKAYTHNTLRKINVESAATNDVRLTTKHKPSSDIKLHPFKKQLLKYRQHYMKTIF